MAVMERRLILFVHIVLLVQVGAILVIVDGDDLTLSVVFILLHRLFEAEAVDPVVGVRYPSFFVEGVLVYLLQGTVGVESFKLCQIAFLVE